MTAIMAIGTGRVNRIATFPREIMSDCLSAFSARTPRIKPIAIAIIGKPKRLIPKARNPTATIMKVSHMFSRTA